MSTTNITTRNLELVFQTPEESRALIDGITPSEKAESSADWLAQIQSAPERRAALVLKSMSFTAAR